MSDSIALTPCRRVDGVLRVPGDKSISHRALFVAMISRGRAWLSNLADSADVRSTARAVDALTGSNLEVRVEREMHEGATRDRDSQILVESRGYDGMRTPNDPIDAGNSGTTMRLLAGILAGSDVSASIIGDASLMRRPMRRVVEPLRTMGASIAAHGPGNTPPLVVDGERLRGSTVELPIASAQVKSAVMFAALRAEGATTITEPAPSRDHTERLLRSLGVPLDISTDRYVVEPTELHGDWSLAIPGDLSSAAFFLVAAAVLPGSRIRVEDVGLNPTRTGILQILRRYGAIVEIEEATTGQAEPYGAVEVRCGERLPMEVAGPLTVSAIDELPLVAVLGAFAEGDTVVRDAAELRVKESDRIATVVEAMRALGADIEATADGFVIHGRGGRGMSGGHVDARGDHRIAMAGAVAAAAVGDGDTVIDGWGSTAVSYPGFGEDLASVAVR